jgi:hypothetical protein
MKLNIEKVLPSLKEDYYAWIIETAKAIREGRFEHIDWDKVAEELEDMGRSERRELRNRLALLLAHLLKWFYQPEERTRSWFLTIKEQRKEILYILEDSPSLKQELKELIPKAYEKALLIAQRETGLEEKAFPPECPWSIEEILNESFPDLNYS